MMAWLRCVGWFVFLLLLLCPIITAEGDEKVIVEEFKETYYLEKTDSVVVSTKITFVGDDYNDDYIPIEVKFYTMDWKVISEENVDNNKVRTPVGADWHGQFIYKYHNYTATFGFETNLTGDLEFRLMVYLGNIQGYNEVYTVHVDPGFNPSDDSIMGSVFFTSTMVIIVIIIIIVMTVVGIAAGKVVMERRELSSEISIGLEISPTDTELEMSMDGNTFKVVPEIRDTRVLESRTSHSEIETDEM